MGAPEGNNFWTKRHKHGRDKIFKTPEELWEAACAYFDYVDKNPFTTDKCTTDYNGTKETIEHHKKPYTLIGLCIFCGVNTSYWRQFKGGDHVDFSTVISQIEEVVYNQKYSGAASGIFNSNIIARDLGLADKKEVEQTEIVADPLKGMTTEELKEVLRKKKLLK